METTPSCNAVSGILDRSAFLKRVADYPVVNRAWILTSDTYGKVRDYNGLVRFTLNTAEYAVSGAVCKAKPVVAKFEVPIAAVDSLACHTLDKLEETVPIVKSTPEEIISETKKLYTVTILEPAMVKYNGVKAYGLGKVNAVADYSVQTAIVLTDTKYGQILTIALDQMLLKADTLVDNYIPQPALEGQPEEPRMQDGGNPIDKVVVLSKKLRQRMAYHGLIQLQAAKKRTDEILMNLQATVDLIYHARTNYLESTNKALKERISQTQTKVLALWEEFNKNADANGAKTFEQKLLFVANHLTNQLNNTYQKLASTLALLPAHIQPSVKLVQDYVTSLYDQFSKAKSWDDVSTVLIAQWRDAVTNLQTLCTQYFDSFLNSRFVNWLVGQLPQINGVVIHVPVNSVYENH